MEDESSVAMEPMMDFWGEFCASVHARAPFPFFCVCRCGVVRETAESAVASVRGGVGA